jgi:predicted flap endonuclease-1-like 5' DNA nuclease
MGYLISQIVSALIVASLLGLVLGWLLRGLAAAREMQRHEAIWQSRLRRAQQRAPASGAVPVAEEAPSPAPQPAARPAADRDDLDAARASVETALSSLARQLEGLTDRLQRLEETPVPAPASEPPPVRATLPADDTLDQVEARIRSTLSATEPEPPARPAPPVQAEPAPPAEPDDLTRIHGVGPALSKALAKAGVTTFATMAGWDETEEERIVAELKTSYRGRIPRATWIDEARQLAAGDEPESTTK